MEKEKIILTLFEMSGTFTKLYEDLGFKVIQVDFLHNQKDVRLMEKIPGEVYGILAFPPCTHFAGSGARWWKQKGDEALLEALSCVDAVMRMVQIYKPKFWALENPVGRLVRYIGKPNYYFNPNEFAGYLENPENEAYTKRTCLWGEFKKPIKNSVEPIHGSMIHKLRNPITNKTYSFNDPEGKVWRSKTPMGFAKAFVKANQ